jgi:hypothetical protein
MSSTAIELVLGKLPGHRRTGEAQWIAKCPAHEDSHASLSISVGTEQQALLKCHAGCPFDEVVRAMELSPTDLFPPKSTERRIVAEYPYTDENGAELFQAVRYEPKDFRQRHKGPNGDWVWKMNGVRRVPYHLPEVLSTAQAGGAMWVAEGEKDVETLRKLGLTATCNPMGAGKWSSDYTAYFKGASAAYVIPDADEAGRRHAEDVATSLLGVVPVVKVVPMPSGKDVTEWLAHGGTVDALGELASATPPLQPNATKPDVVLDWPEPTPLAAEAGPTFPADALPTKIGQFVHAVARARQVPLAMPAGVALGALSVAGARKAVVELSPDHHEPTNVYVGVVAQPGSRKSAVHEELTRPLKQFERTEAQRRAPEMRRLALQREQLEAERDKAKKEGDWALAQEKLERLEALPRVVEFRLLASDVTAQRLSSMLAEQCGRLGVLSAEPDAFSVMAGRWSNSTGPELDVFLKGHAGDTILVDRQGGRTEHVEGPALTLCLCAQPSAMQRLARVDGVLDRGVFARFLWVMPEDLRGTRDVRHVASVPASVRAEYDACISRMLELPAPVELEHVPTLRLCPGAQELWWTFSEEIERRLGRGGDLRDMSGWGEKLCGLVARLAGLFHLTEYGVAGTIAKTELMKAMDVGRWAIEHAKTAFGVAGLTPAMQAAQAILELLRLKGGDPNWVPTTRNVHQALKGSTRWAKADSLDPGFALLAEHGWLRFTAKASGPGRKSSPFAVHPILTASEFSKPPLGTDSEDSENEDGSQGSAP